MHDMSEKSAAVEAARKHSVPTVAATVGERSGALIAALRARRVDMRHCARRMNLDEPFPSQIIDWLREVGALVAPVPSDAQGLGWACEPGGTQSLVAALRIIGSVSLAAGRIYEAHVNAVALIARFGEPALCARAWADIRDGHLFGLWIASGSEPVRTEHRFGHMRLFGTKPFCTAGGFATRALLTFTQNDGQEQMVVINTDQVRIDGSGQVMHGMWHTATRALSFDQDLDPSQWLGGPGDYFAEPDFTAGAWRTSAVTVGGLEALVDEAIAQLRARARHKDPHQSRRIGWMCIARETARMWVEEAAGRTGRAGADSADIRAYVNLARIAVEQACLDVIPLVQRSLGLPAMVASNPIEAMMRDLATYLRQPAGDEILSDAAIHIATRDTQATHR